MAGRVTGRRDDHHRAVAEHVIVTLELGHRMLRLKARRAALARPFVFGLLHKEHGLRKQLDIADVIRMGVRNRHPLMSPDLTPSASSCDASVLLRLSRSAPLAPITPSGVAATASASPVSQRNHPWS